MEEPIIIKGTINYEIVFKDGQFYVRSDNHDEAMLVHFMAASKQLDILSNEIRKKENRKHTSLHFRREVALAKIICTNATKEIAKAVFNNQNNGKGEKDSV